MNKYFKSYLIIWAIAVAIFNVVALVPTQAITGLDSVEGTFWIGLVFINVALIAQLLASFVALNEKNATKLFYNLPVFFVSRTALIFNIIVGVVCMLIPGIPEWLGAVICFIVLGLSAIAVFKAKAPGDFIGELDKRVKAQTIFIKSITVSAQNLVSQAKSDDVRKECRKVYEALRYSDPMSNEGLTDVENQITSVYNELVSAVESDNVQLAAVSSNNLIGLIAARNNRCKLLK